MPLSLCHSYYEFNHWPRSHVILTHCKCFAEKKTIEGIDLMCDKCSVSMENITNRHSQKGCYLFSSIDFLLMFHESKKCTVMLKYIAKFSLFNENHVRVINLTARRGQFNMQAYAWKFALWFYMPEWSVYNECHFVNRLPSVISCNDLVANWFGLICPDQYYICMNDQSYVRSIPHITVFFCNLVYRDAFKYTGP